MAVPLRRRAPLRRRRARRRCAAAVPCCSTASRRATLPSDRHAPVAQSDATSSAPTAPTTACKSWRCRAFCQLISRRPCATRACLRSPPLPAPQLPSTRSYRTCRCCSTPSISSACTRATAHTLTSTARTRSNARWRPVSTACRRKSATTRRLDASCRHLYCIVACRSACSRWHRLSACTSRRSAALWARARPRCATTGRLCRCVVLSPAPNLALLLPVYSCLAL
mmetsp:Transcript_13439/g.23216  ORF Transcript_13439/g.23216 Transcript_13439/m.23216 type:complete len:225 (-) Transcript_13439:879-1553(-)